MIRADSIQFRPLQVADLPLMHRWLSTPHVSRWYFLRQPSVPPTYEEVVVHYTARIAGKEPTKAFLILYEGKPVAYIQSYRIADHPDYGRHIDESADAAGVDVFIGEAEYIHQGLGPVFIRKFLREIVFADSRVGSCIIGPEPENRAAIRAYEKAGFRYVKTIRVPDEPQPEYLMSIVREDVVE
ncbi:MAG: acetyltransferase [Chloroflexota bacterium]|nr:acetyltransferase [Chloroflexota bacterium]